MAYLRKKKDFETGFLLNGRLSFKGCIRRTSPLLVLKQYKNIRFTFKATVYAGDKSKMKWRLVVKLAAKFHLWLQARRQDLAAGGPKTRWRGKKTEVGPHF